MTDDSSVHYPFRLGVALTLEQVQRIENAARSAGLKPGVYARYILTGQPMPEPPRPMADMEAVRALQGIGNNLNQLAKIGWRDGLDPVAMAATRQAILDSAALVRHLLGLSDLEPEELEKLHPRPVVVERVEVKPASSAIADLLAPKPKLGF